MRFTAAVEVVLDADLTGQPNTWSWTDYTDKTFEAGKVVIKRGRPDRYSSAPPATCGLTLNNTGGVFVPSNPMSELYGRIGINTPLRVLMRSETNQASDTFTRSVSNGWGTSSSGHVWTSTGTAANFSVSSTFGRHTHSSANVPLYSTLGAFTMLRSDITVRVRVNALSTGAPQTVACVSRFVDASNANRCEFRFGTDQSISIRAVSRSAGTDSPSIITTTTGLTHSTSIWYWLRVQIGRSTIRAKAWVDGTTQPRNWMLDGGNGVETANPTANKPGLYSVRETGNTNASATLDFDDFTLVDGVVPQFTGFVDEWPTRWFDASGKQSYVPITASGQLRRVQQEPTLRSALYRAFTQTYRSSNPTVVAYWPMEDGQNAQTFASAVGGPSMKFSGFTPSSDTSFAGSDALPVANSGGAQFTGSVRAYTSPSPNAWSVRAVAKFPTAATTNSVLLLWNTAGGSAWRWQLIIGTGVPDTFKLQAFDGFGTEKLGAATVNFTDSAGAELYGTTDRLVLSADAVQNGANIDWSYTLTFIDTNGRDLGKVGSGSTAGTLGNVSRVFGIIPNGFTSGGYTLGHIAVGTDVNLLPVAPDLITGYAGETTNSRFIRLCDEQNFAFLFGDLATGSGSSTQLLGPQNTSSMQAQLQQVEATEEGILFDGKQGHVQILPRSSRRNRSVDLDLDVGQGEVNWPFEPTLDRFLVRNDITVANPAGSSARVIAAGDVSPAAIGVFPETVQVNTYLDSELDNHANYRLNMGVASAREGRVPGLVLNFARTPALIDSWLNSDIGSRATVANTPNVLDPTPLDVLVDGYTETIDRTVWTAALNCSPSTVWSNFTLEASGNQGRLDSYASYLMAGYTSSDTTMRVAKPKSRFGLSNGQRWSTTAEPYDWEIAGERLTVTTMGANTPTLVNVGTAAHGDNASVVPGLPASIQAGDLLLVLTAIRNTAAFAGSVTGGWTVLATGGNVVLLGKYASASETAPTCSFSGGAAGDTTSAVIAAFRYVQMVTSAVTAVQSNGSAQNIAVPGLDADRYRTLVIACGWKQDDYTSVATLSGFTEISEASTTTGNDQSLIWDYRVLSGTTTQQASDTFVVTGGAAAISKSFMIALAGDVQEATVTRSVNGVVKAQSSGSTVSLWRPGRVAL